MPAAPLPARFRAAGGRAVGRVLRQFHLPRLLAPALLAPRLLAPRLLAPALLATSLLFGCKLIDQNTFAPSPSTNPALLPTPPTIDKRLPLLTIDHGTPVAQYQGLLHYAVEQAEHRDPSVAFDVLIVLPAAGTAESQASQVTESRTEATAVMQQIIAAGVPPDRVHLRAGLDHNVTRRQLRVYVR
ncbi:MAG: hypothetical protein ACRDNZ_22435 [Streptosporangiaceae bacterium]